MVLEGPAQVAWGSALQRHQSVPGARVFPSRRGLVSASLAAVSQLPFPLAHGDGQRDEAGP